MTGVPEGRCGYTVVDADGEQQPCDEPATGWRWYQDVGEHEDLLDVACEGHSNEGGRRIAAGPQVWDECADVAGDMTNLDVAKELMEINPYREHGKETDR